MHQHPYVVVVSTQLMQEQYYIWKFMGKLSKMIFGIIVFSSSCGEKKSPPEKSIENWKQRFSSKIDAFIVEFPWKTYLRFEKD